MNKPKIQFRHKHNKGFTLLEALIGFLVLSIGMLGIASLQALSLKAGKSSVYGSVAVMKVEELLESMRANPTGLPAYAGGGAANGCTGTAITCTADALAADEVFLWKANLTAGLPASVGTTVKVEPLAGSNMATVTVTVDWSERNSESKSSADSSIARFYATTAIICTTNPC